MTITIESDQECYFVYVPEPEPDQLFDMVARYCGLPPYDVRFVPRIVSVTAPTEGDSECGF